MPDDIHSDPDDRGAAAAVQAFIRARAQDGPRIGPFSILLSPDDASPFANYAVPADGARPSPAEIAALEAAFQTRGRVPRLEYAPAAAPAVEAALLAAGFSVELRPPLMTRRPGQAKPAPTPAGFALGFVDTAELLAEAARAAAEAFGGDPADGQWLLATVAAGGRVVLARDRETGEAAGTGAFVAPFGGVTELVGIGVRPAFRRRGLAQAMTDALARSAFDLGCAQVFLSAAGESQAAIYARAGFVRRSPMLFISKPG